MYYFKSLFKKVLFYPEFIRTNKVKKITVILGILNASNDGVNINQVLQSQPEIVPRGKPTWECHWIYANN